MKPIVEILLCAALAATFAAGCFPKTAPAPELFTVSDEVESARLAAGHKLFIEECNLCHGYPDIVYITPDRWPELAQRMGKKAKLSADEVDTVLHFILAARAKQVEPVGAVGAP